MLPFNPFSALTSKIFGGVAIAAITFGGIQTWRVGNLKDTVEKRDATIAEYKVAEKINLASIEELVQAVNKTTESINNAKKIQDTKKKDAEVALSEAKRQSLDLQDQIENIRSEGAAEGVFCPTPSSIINAKGL